MRAGQYAKVYLILWFRLVGVAKVVDYFLINPRFLGRLSGVAGDCIRLSAVVGREAVRLAPSVCCAKSCVKTKPKIIHTEARFRCEVEMRKVIRLGQKV